MASFTSSGLTAGSGGGSGGGGGGAYTILSQTSPSNSTVVLELPSGYDSFKLIIIGVPRTTTQRLLCQSGTDESTFDTTAANYSTAQVSYAGTGTSTTNMAGIALSTTTFSSTLRIDGEYLINKGVSSSYGMKVSGVVNEIEATTAVGGTMWGNHEPTTNAATHIRLGFATATGDNPTLSGLTGTVILMGRASA